MIEPYNHTYTYEKEKLGTHFDSLCLVIFLSLVDGPKLYVLTLLLFWA